MKILELPDLHVPFTDMKRIEEVYKFNRHYKADLVLNSGDFHDMYFASKFLKSPDSMSAKEEIRAAKVQIDQIHKWFPKMRILRGNHEDRLLKRSKEAGIPSGLIKQIWQHPLIGGIPKGWHQLTTQGEKHDGIFFTHGWLSTRKKHAVELGCNVSIGHLHSELGIDFVKRHVTSGENEIVREQFFVTCVGVIADTKALVFEYGQEHLDKWAQGFGYFTNGKPHVESLA